MWGSPCDEGRLTEWNDQGKLANRKAVYSPVLATLLSTRENLFERLTSALVRMRSRHSLADPSILPRFILR
jgi:hypothetical protein